MTTQMYNIVAHAASSIVLSPLLLMVPLSAALVIVTGLAGRIVIVLEDLRYNELFSRSR